MAGIIPTNLGTSANRRPSFYLKAVTSVCVVREWGGSEGPGNNGMKASSPNSTRYEARTTILTSPVFLIVQVGRYVELAQDALRACCDGSTTSTLGTARWENQTRSLLLLFAKHTGVRPPPPVHSNSKGLSRPFPRFPHPSPFYFTREVVSKRVASNPYFQPLPFVISNESRSFRTFSE